MGWRKVEVTLKQNEKSDSIIDCINLGIYFYQFTEQISSGVICKGRIKTKDKIMSMYQQTALSLMAHLVRQIKLGDPLNQPTAKQKEDIVTSFMLAKLGIPTIPLPWPPQPLPDPSPEFAAVNSEILFEVASDLVIGGDPDPQPDRAGVFGLLRDRSVRLAATRKLSKDLEIAQAKLKAEISSLEQMK